MRRRGYGHVTRRFCCRAANRRRAEVLLCVAILQSCNHAVMLHSPVIRFAFVCSLTYVGLLRWVRQPGHGSRFSRTTERAGVQ